MTPVLDELREHFQVSLASHRAFEPSLFQDAIEAELQAHDESADAIVKNVTVLTTILRELILAQGHEDSPMNSPSVSPTAAIKNDTQQ